MECKKCTEKMYGADACKTCVESSNFRNNVTFEDLTVFTQLQNLKTSKKSQKIGKVKNN